MSNPYDPFISFFDDNKTEAPDPFTQLLQADADNERMIAELKAKDQGAPSMDSLWALGLGANVDVDPIGALVMGATSGAIGAAAKEGSTLAGQIGAKAVGGSIGAASNSLTEVPIATGLHYLDRGLDSTNLIDDRIKAGVRLGAGLALGHAAGKAMNPLERSLTNRIVGGSVAPSADVRSREIIERDLLREQLGLDPLQRTPETSLAPDTGVLNENVNSRSSSDPFIRTTPAERIDANLVRTEVDPELALLRQKLEETTPLNVDPVDPEIAKLRTIIEARAAEEANAAARAQLARDMADPEVRARANDELVNRDVENMYPQERVDSTTGTPDSELVVGPRTTDFAQIDAVNPNGLDSPIRIDEQQIVRDPALTDSRMGPPDAPVNDMRAGADEGLRDPMDRFRTQDGRVDTDSFIQAIEETRARVNDTRTQVDESLRDVWDANSGQRGDGGEYSLNQRIANDVETWSNKLQDSWDRHFAQGADNASVRADLNDIYSRAVADVEANAKIDGPGKLYSTPVHLFFNAFERAYAKYKNTPLWDVAADKYFHKFLVPLKMMDDFVRDTPGLRSSLLNPRVWDSDYRGTMEGSKDFATVSNKYRNDTDGYARYAENIGKRMAAYGRDDQIKMAEYMKEGFDNHKVDLTPEMKELAEEAQDILWALGKESSELGSLPVDIFNTNAGKYFPRLYSMYEQLNGRKMFDDTVSFTGDRFKKRKDIDETTREGMGEIKTSAYPTAKGILEIGRDNAAVRFFNAVEKDARWTYQGDKVEVLPHIGPAGEVQYGVWKNGEVVSSGLNKKAADSMGKNLSSQTREAALREGFVPLPEDRRLGALSGKHVHPEIADDFKYMVGEWRNGAWEKALSEWRFWKSVGSPKAHIRNTIGNSMMAHLGGLPMYKQPLYLARAYMAIKNQTPEYLAAASQGLGRNTFSHTEFGRVKDDNLKGLIYAKDDPEGYLGAMQTVSELYPKLKDGLAKAYGNEEALFKVAMFMHGLKNNMNAVQSAERANKWLFDYSKQSTALRRFTNSPLGAPFAVFPVKALPRLVEAAATAPHRFIFPAMLLGTGTAITNTMLGDDLESANAKRKFTREYMRGGVGATIANFLPDSVEKYVSPMLPNFFRLPTRDEFGQDRYLDLSYFFPWSDLVDDSKSGVIPLLPSGLQPGSNPFTKILTAPDYDTFLKKKLTSDTDVAGLDGNSINDFGSEKWMKAQGNNLLNAGKNLLPSVVTDAYKLATDKNKMDKKGRFRSAEDIALDGVAFKVTPIDYQDEFINQIRKIAPDPKVSPVARELIYKAEGYAKKIAQANAIKQQYGRDIPTEDYMKEIEHIKEQLMKMGGQTARVLNDYKKAMKK